MAFQLAIQTVEVGLNLPCLQISLNKEKYDLKVLLFFLHSNMFTEMFKKCDTVDTENISRKC